MSVEEPVRFVPKVKKVEIEPLPARKTQSGIIGFQFFQPAQGEVDRSRPVLQMLFIFLNQVLENSLELNSSASENAYDAAAKDCPENRWTVPLLNKLFPQEINACLPSAAKRPRVPYFSRIFLTTSNAFVSWKESRWYTERKKIVFQFLVSLGSWRDLNHC